MSVDIRSSDRRRYMIELQAREKEIAAGVLKSSEPSSPKAVQENEKRIRREIANSNERRRMQCINAGFSSLRALIPQLEGEKLSKAAILQHASEYISSLEKDKSRLEKQLEHTKGMLVEFGQDRVVTEAFVSSSPPPSKRKKRDTESSDEGVCSLSDASDDGGSELQQVNLALRHQMEVERLRYNTLEEQFRLLETELLALLRVRACHPGSLSELSPVNLEHRSLHEEYKRQVIASREAVVPSPRFENFQPPLPMSPPLDQGMLQETSSQSDVPTQRTFVIDSTCYSAGEPMDVAPESEHSLSSSTTTTALPPTDQHSFQHNNYCHRDHPRRRHRQQAQLEQQRLEEERLQQQAQQERAAAAYLHRPKQNTQNLEKLVEAIRQIEGDRVLCKFYDEEQTFFEKHRSGPNEESERETSSVSDQEELKSESSGRESPLHLHRHNRQQQQNITSDNLAACGISDSSFSEKYPIASHLLHQPLHPSCYRPGVIVHKQ